ncbi:hypothetical protein AMTR_s00070p00081870 [Amborella trichopoda]|uniref:Uncharacterized protein n=1 Tax=Amborella trichopoda TaxID=13333 RepID=U5DEG1_AMBTC|nr:hypothetical protein AMTR_s00070p00081870 [Amborella trichopoda]
MAMKIHTKKRNKLEQKRLNDLVFVQYNQKLQERHRQLEHNEREVIEAFDINDTCEGLINANDDEVFPRGLDLRPSLRGCWDINGPYAYHLSSISKSKPKEGEGEGPTREGSGEGEEERDDIKRG